MFSYIWLGVVQRDPLAVGQWRHYKWKRSDVDIPSTEEMWANRYVPSEVYPEACGFFNTNKVNSLLHDDLCTEYHRFICEWWTLNVLLTFFPWRPVRTRRQRFYFNLSSWMGCIDTNVTVCTWPWWLLSWWCHHEWVLHPFTTTSSWIYFVIVALCERRFLCTLSGIILSSYLFRITLIIKLRSLMSCILLLQYLFEDVFQNKKIFIKWKLSGTTL